MEGEWREKDDGRYERRKGRMGGQGEMEKRRRVKKKINKGGGEVEKGIYPLDQVFIHTFSARSLRSRTTVCKMGNPLQVEHKVTSNGLISPEVTLSLQIIVLATWTISSTRP